MGLIGLLRRKKKKVEPIEEPQDEAPRGPELFVLVPDIAGAPTYRVNRFPNGAEGTQFIDGSIAPLERPGAHIFWALHEGPSSTTPDDGDSGEALVLIRPARNEDTIHIVSFVDVESAQSFARFEVKRGLDLGLLMIYWAAFAQVVETPFGLRLDPAEAPVYERPSSIAEATPPVDPTPSPASASGDAPVSTASVERGGATLSEDDLEPELRIMPEPETEHERDEAFDTSEPEREPKSVTEGLDTHEPWFDTPTRQTSLEEDSREVESIAAAEEQAAVESPQATDERESTEPSSTDEPTTEEPEPLVTTQDEPDEIESIELVAEPPAIGVPRQFAEHQRVESMASDDASTPDDELTVAQFTEETLAPGTTEITDAPIGESTQDSDDPVVAEAGSDGDELPQSPIAEADTGLETDAGPEAASEFVSESEEDNTSEGTEIKKLPKVKRWEKREQNEVLETSDPETGPAATDGLDAHETSFDTPATQSALEDESREIEPIEPAEEPAAESPQTTDEHESMEPSSSAPPMAEEQDPSVMTEDEPDEVGPVELAAEPPAIEAPQQSVEPEPVESIQSDDVSAPNDELTVAEFTEETLALSTTEKARSPLGDDTQDMGDPVLAEAGSDGDELPQSPIAEADMGIETDVEPEAASELASGSDQDDTSEDDGAGDEFQKILKVKRWEKRDRPFSGFDSPPGRF